jgi:UDP-glucose 4-epimerase
MRVLITGSSGQIGTNLGLELLDTGHEVVGVDIRPNDWTTRIPTHCLDLAVAPVDGLPRWRIGPAVVGSVDAVVHLAAHAKVHALVERPLGALENHIMATNALEFARVNGIPILLASSREVYGNSIARGVPVPETAADLRAAPSPYAAMKLASESLAASYQRCYRTPFAVVRFSNVYGRFDHDLWRLERAIWVFRDRIARGLPVTVYGADKVLDFTHVDDAVAGIKACLVRLIAGDRSVVGETFNLAHGTGHRLVGVVDLIADALGRRPHVRIEPARAGEVTWYVADVSKARDSLNYHPKVPVTVGVPRAVREAPPVAT